ncbi:MAG: flagellar biosynthesis anti-sigma factor FlgM [Burkholderiaceae bacterium]|nr:flagellar biosynthesis anti-sigma factor FlgM [Burkholderiaceae bacterium]
MKIGSIDNKPITPAGNDNASAAASGKPAAGGRQPEASATVALSPVATLLVNDANAEFNAEKVARIAQAIRDGKFKINAEAIADKLIGNAKEMLAGPQH